MSTLVSRRKAALLGALATLMVIALAGASGANAATIHACLKKKSGAVRILSGKAKCKKGEKKISWNTTGPAGKNGLNGAPGAPGAPGKEGAPGQPQKAVTFNHTLAASFESPPSVALFTLSEVSVKMLCFSFIANFNTLEANAPVGSHSEMGMVVTNANSETPEINQEPVWDVEFKSTATEDILRLSSNLKEPFANIAHVNGSIATPHAVVIVDAFMEAGANPNGCTIRGTAFSIPL